jgi:serine/threonine protein kinase
MDIARGVRVLHDLRLIHGDVRAENVEINDQGRPLLTGFGWTKVRSASDIHTTSTYALQWADEMGRAVVTSSLRAADQPRFRAPECNTSAVQSFKGDIFSFGMTMLQVQYAMYERGRYR